ncbi:hypothetical protein P171DRAFT_484880 [Karstenula rhodostoma CBS 690.94]|uniref:Uncharacterized protein n=1 Tax=Karstenula rhodostoma CBS 690.94 TaxID=1392251 RepID=A0A9P4UCW8_9PLEO|nr:hypothetical protein P171DRAFT_484880 [Karstenula rhodostoma CBS 690.94]
MADPELWNLYFRLFDPPEDPRAKRFYAHLGSSAREQCRRQYRIALESDRDRLQQCQSLFHQRRGNFKSYTPRRLSKFKQNPYILAYQYRQFMDESDRRRCVGAAWRERANPYYENLLANQDEPSPNATDDLSRAIRYAKEHHECFYEKSQVAMIIEILDKRNTSMQPPLDDQKRARLDLLYNTALPYESANEHVDVKK